MRILFCGFIIALLFAAVVRAGEIADAGPFLINETVYTKDKVPISIGSFRNGHPSVIVICHGFYNSKENRWMRKAAEALSLKYDVMMMDMRGHGKSGGRYTWSAKEDMDIDAVVDHAATLGYNNIGIMAFSLGAASAINSAALRKDIGSMVLISCPSKFEAINYHFWEPSMFCDLRDNISCGWQGKGARTTHLFIAKRKPIDSIRHIKDTPILFIHGDNDWVIKDSHSRKLFDAMQGPKRLEIISGGMHAERLIEFDTEGMMKLIIDWFDQTLRKPSLA